MLEARLKARSVEKIKASRNEPKALAEARLQAKALVKRVAHRVGRLTVTFADSSPKQQAELSLDGRDIEAAALAEGIELDPGSHALLMRVAGRAPIEQQVSLTPGQQKAIRLSAAGDETADSSGRSAGLSPLVWTGFGIAGAGVVLGSVMGALAAAQSADLDEVCVLGADGKDCPPAFAGPRDDALVKAHVSTAGFAMAVWVIRGVACPIKRHAAALAATAVWRLPLAFAWLAIAAAKLRVTARLFFAVVVHAARLARTPAIVRQVLSANLGYAWRGFHKAVNASLMRHACRSIVSMAYAATTLAMVSVWHVSQSSPAYRRGAAAPLRQASTHSSSARRSIPAAMAAARVSPHCSASRGSRCAAVYHRGQIEWSCRFWRNRALLSCGRFRRSFASARRPHDESAPSRACRWF